MPEFIESAWLMYTLAGLLGVSGMGAGLVWYQGHAGEDGFFRLWGKAYAYWLAAGSLYGLGVFALHDPLLGRLLGLLFWGSIACLVLGWYLSRKE